MKISRALLTLAFLALPLTTLPVKLPTATSPWTGALANRITFQNNTNSDLTVDLKERTFGACKGSHYQKAIAQGNTETVYARDCKIEYISLYFIDSLGNLAVKNFYFPKPWLGISTFEITGNVNNPDSLTLNKK